MIALVATVAGIWSGVAVVAALVLGPILARLGDEALADCGDES